jgi:hypothetical protein
VTAAFLRGTSLRPGRVTFVSAGGAVSHDDFVTHAWRADPIRWLLAELAANGDCQG